MGCGASTGQAGSPQKPDSTPTWNNANEKATAESKEPNEECRVADTLCAQEEAPVSQTPLLQAEDSPDPKCETVHGPSLPLEAAVGSRSVDELDRPEGTEALETSESSMGPLGNEEAGDVVPAASDVQRAESVGSMGTSLPHSAKVDVAAKDISPGEQDLSAEDPGEVQEDRADMSEAGGRDEEDVQSDQPGSESTEQTMNRRITITVQKQETKDGTLRVEIAWAVNAESENSETLSMSDSLYLIPSPMQGSWDEDGWYRQLALVQPSGRPRGTVVMELTGLVVRGGQYEVHYVIESGLSSLDLGHSAPLHIPDSDIPSLSDAQTEEACARSRQANGASSIQHYILDAISKSDALQYNPLLTVEPEASTWKKLLREMEAGRQQRVERAQETSGQKQKQTLGQTQTPAQPNQMLAEADFIAGVTAAFNRSRGFIYAGAGVSMSPPSCSPSWWKLMNDLLAATFARAPPEFAHAVANLAGGDVSRQPEEIMESYYLVFKDHLFTLFQLLDKGEPNANHIGMAKLAKANKLKAILTTNFDIFIERALAQEGLPYTVVVTNEEFEQYCKHGCNGLAILKIHGTIDRPNTIVAVSNHYKMGKGFGGWKATATSRLMHDCPTLFLGYSGWDFLHKNYQDYWAAQAEVGGEPVFWMTNKAIPKTRPNLRKVVGSHIGDRLQLGASALPDLMLEMLQEWDSEGRADVMRVHDGGAGAKASVEADRDAFVRQWVADLPEVPVMTLLLLEAMTLNKSSQERYKKSKEGAREAEGAGNNSEMAAFYMQLAGEMAAGKITAEEYQHRIELSTLDLTLVHLQMPKSTKEEIKELVIQTTKDDQAFADGPDGQFLRCWLPSLVMAAGEGLEYDSSAEEVVERAMAYLRRWVLPLMGKTDRYSSLLRDTFTCVTAPLRCAKEADAERVCQLMIEFVENGLEAKWDDEKFNAERYSDLQKTIDKAVTGRVDTLAVVEVQVNIALGRAEEGDDAGLLRDALSIGLGLLRLAPVRTAELWECKGLVELSGRLQTEADKVSMDDIVAVEDEVAMKGALRPLREAVEKVKGKGGERVGECSNVLAALDLAVSTLFLEIFPYLGDGYATSNALEHKGYYANAAWPAPCQDFARDRLLRELDVDSVTDERVLQPLLGAMAQVGHAVDDVALMLDACSRSLALTEGKVTELTPAPIPECLAAAYQRRGDFTQASQWYGKALDGLRTSVMRHKADAIVLNACLVEATVDKMAALTCAIKTSPFFGSSQQFSMVGPGRSLLVQQCEKWAAELGFSSLAEAEAKISSAAQ